MKLPQQILPGIIFCVNVEYARGGCPETGAAESLLVSHGHVFRGRLRRPPRDYFSAKCCTCSNAQSHAVEPAGTAREMVEHRKHRATTGRFGLFCGLRNMQSTCCAIARIQSGVGRIDPDSADAGQTWQRLGKLYLNLIDVGPSFTKFGQLWPKLGIWQELRAALRRCSGCAARKYPHPLDFYHSGCATLWRPRAPTSRALLRTSPLVARLPIAKRSGGYSGVRARAHARMRLRDCACRRTAREMSEAESHLSLEANEMLADDDLAEAIANIGGVQIRRDPPPPASTMLRLRLYSRM